MACPEDTVWQTGKIKQHLICMSYKK